MLNIQFLFHVFYLKKQFTTVLKDGFVSILSSWLVYYLILVYFQLFFYIRIVLIKLDSSVVKILILF